jgi:hypothetical protein
MTPAQDDAEGGALLDHSGITTTSTTPKRTA